MKKLEKALRKAGLECLKTWAADNLEDYKIEGNPELETNDLWEWLPENHPDSETILICWTENRLPGLPDSESEWTQEQRHSWDAVYAEQGKKLEELENKIMSELNAKAKDAAKQYRKAFKEIQKNFINSFKGGK